MLSGCIDGSLGNFGHCKQFSAARSSARDGLKKLVRTLLIAPAVKLAKRWAK
jgi:hypothetical protein